MTSRLLAIAVLITALRAFGQVPIATPAFEVASIKLAQRDAKDGGYRFEPGGRTVVKSFTLKNLIQIGWHLQAFRIVGGAAWMDSTRYDVEAKAEGTPSEDESRLMLQSLLVDRFRLALRRETRELPMYALVREKSGMRPGAGLVPAKQGGCTPLGDFAGPPPQLEPGRPPGCGFKWRLRTANKSEQDAPLMQMQGLGVPMSLLARALGNLLECQVADDTGISGSFDVSLEYVPGNNLLARASVDGPPDTAGPAIFTALQEQLGLKLEARKGPVEVFVIGHADRPSEN